ncbi:hypothetical protein GF389_01010 [Candidatus Dojkabacteria bacterium]|nr:hypothetical protein [Candidatus Dojkabacteria bacterium]
MKVVIEVLRDKKFYLGVGFFLCSLIATYLANQFLDRYYPAPVRPGDLILDRVKEMKSFIILGEILVVSQIAALVVSAFKRKGKVAGRYFFAAGLLYFFRAFVMILNPLEELHQTNGSHIPVISEMFYGGMFFSGHTAFVFLAYYLEKDKGLLKNLMLANALTVVLCLILGNSHYSIDILGGYLVAFFLARTEYWKYLKL